MKSSLLRFLAHLKAYHIYKVCLFVLLLCTTTSTSFPQRFLITEFNVNNGLPQSTVNSMLQDHSGYMWFGTFEGLAKFDGRNFTTFTTKNGLIDNTIRNVMEDSKGNIWIATDKGVSKYDGNVFTNFPAKDLIGEGASFWCLVEDNSGVIWAGTKGQGVIKIAGGQRDVLNTNNGLTDNNVFSLMKDNQGSIWIGTDKGITVIKKNSIIVHYDSASCGLPNAPVRAMFQKKDGSIWIAVKGIGLGKFTNEQFVFRNQSDGLLDNAVYSIEEDKHGNLWIGTAAGASKLDNSGTFTSFTTREGLTAAIVYCIKADFEGNLWFGLIDGGVNLLRSERFSFYTGINGLPNDVVYAIQEDLEGNIWVGTDNGVMKITGKTFTIYNTKNGLCDNSVRSIALDLDGTLWFGTLQGVSRYKGGMMVPFTQVPELQESLIGKIYADRKGRVWVGTDKHGLFCFEKGIVSHYTSYTGLLDNQVESFCEDNQGRIWIASYDKGISIFDGSIFTYLYDQNQIFKQSLIYDMSRTDDGRICISTKNNGIYIYNGVEFVNYSTKDGLSNNVCYFTFDDGKGQLWIGTNSGLNRYDGKTFRVYNSKTGLITNEFNSGAYYKGINGYLWFGSVKGLVRYNPSYDKINTIPPPVFITKFRIFEREVPLNQGISLKYFENYVKFDFTAICYSSPEEVRYQYKLVGVDNDWQNSNLPIVQYTELKAGDYEFHVRASNSDGVWTTTPAVFKFTILPPWWERLWFRISALLIIMLAIYLAFLFRTYQLRRRNVELSRLVRERTKELEVEKNKSDDLLLNILPAETVRELKEKGKTIPREYKDISILFTDFAGFTQISSNMDPAALVSELNEIFGAFDAIVEKYGLEKLKTIGDSYMIAGGVPLSCEDNALKIILAGMELQSYLLQRNANNNIDWKMRIGVHSGNVVAGVVGKRKFTFDVWGDTVNVASRMESAGDSGKINISSSTYELVKEYFTFEYRGKVHAKGKGEIDMYYIASVKQSTLDMYKIVNISGFNVSS